MENIVIGQIYYHLSCSDRWDRSKHLAGKSSSIILDVFISLGKFICMICIPEVALELDS